MPYDTIDINMFFFSDAVTTERAVELAANTKGLCYIRLSRPATEVSFNDLKRERKISYVLYIL